jgi:hypothetical protein
MIDGLDYNQARVLNELRNFKGEDTSFHFHSCNPEKTHDLLSELKNVNVSRCGL